MDFLSLLLGGQMRSWLEAALLVCLFVVAVFRPERIRSMAEFRLACFVFALTVIAPTGVNLFLTSTKLFSQQGPRFGGGGFPTSTQDPGIWMYAAAIPAILLTVSFLLAIDAVIPRRPRGVFHQPPPGPQE